MWAVTGVINAFWIAAIIIAKAEGWLAWGWARAALTALAPMIVIGLLCWWAAAYDAYHANDQR